jgi:cytoskeletal protein CcmA (bactofilin family)
LGGSGAISFNGNYKNQDSEFQGLVSSEGGRTVDDSSMTLRGNVLFDGNLTDTSKELFTMGKWSAGGSVSVDENFADLGGSGFVEFDGKSNSGVQVLKDLGLYNGGATFEGKVRTEGSHIVNEDDSVTLEGTVQVNNDTIAGNVTVQAADISLFLEAQNLELTLEDQFKNSTQFENSTCQIA